ncbi:MAG: hypothetical protein LCH54_10380 [Bacteroidetes bacterium]|nr:hypothetical protein [Bacteroidota bacterium]
MQFSSSVTHKWKFFRSGGFDQVRLETSDDLMNLDQLDKKLWAVLSCPVNGLRFDKKTLELIDTDKDGRIRVPEIIAAVKWTGTRLKNPADITKQSDSLSLNAINDQTPEGKQILASARQILLNLGKTDSTHITSDDSGDLAKILKGTRFNGDGIITVLSGSTDEEKSLIQTIIDLTGSTIDRSGDPGISESQIISFFNQLESYLAWFNQSQEKRKILFPLGDETTSALKILNDVKVKIDDYFTRCLLSSFDEKASPVLNASESEFASLSPLNLNESSAGIATLPLSKIEAGKNLNLTSGINPAWSARIESFHQQVVVPLLGKKTTISRADWLEINQIFAPFEAWQSEKPETKVESVSPEEMKKLLSGGMKEQLLSLITQDNALVEEAAGIDSVDKLVRFHRDLFRLLNNFVSFRDFYTKKDKAIFQAGELYLDGRCCELCIEVEDAGKHSPLANLSGTYLAYCQLIRRGTGEKMVIAAAFTNGGTENLMVGRNGVFYDRSGSDWDATIIKILDHPISIRQAFFAPYQRLARMISQQLEKMAAAKDKAIEQKQSAHVSTTAVKTETLGQQATTAPAAQPAVQQPFDVGKFAGIFAAIGLAIGAIGGVLAAILGGILGLHWWQMPLAFAGLILIISGPSMVLAWLKLRMRNLSPILDSNGWAVNTQAKINLPFGRSLTEIAKLPEGSERSLQDPYAEKKRPWKLYWALAILLFIALYLWDQGYIQSWIGMEVPAPPAIPAATK